MSFLQRQESRFFKNFILFTGLVFWMANCGGASDSNTNDDTNDTTDDTTNTVEETINTEKLIGTPFEGLEIGDTLEKNIFYCGEYQTLTIGSLPMKLFTAFFTEDEEAIIQEGIDVANEAADTVLFELTDSWFSGAMIIYKVDEIDDPPNAAGITNGIMHQYNGTAFAATLLSDWLINLEPDVINQWDIAHELGHAAGIRVHDLIDYENDTRSELEENSLMADYRLDPPALNDYAFMMQKQTEIITSHLSETSSDISFFGGDDCPEE